MNKLYHLLVLWLLGGVLHAQQDPMFTNYHFNSLVFNPAYAGANEHLTANLMHRQQWVGFDGAPVTQTFTVHSPLKTPRVGVGFCLVHDQIGPTGAFDLAASYAYRMLIGKKKNLKLAIGMQASLMNWHTDILEINLEHAGDPSFQENYSRWMPNFGVGAHLSGSRFYAAIGCPRLVENDLRKPSEGQVGLNAKTFRHFYTALGAILPVNGDQVMFRPSMLLKSVGLGSSFRTDDAFKNIGSPTALNLDAAFFLRQTYWLGITFRTAVQAQKSSSDSIDFWAAWCMRNGFRLGAAYGLTLSKFQNAGRNSFELMMGYEFDIKVKKVASPRYF